MLWLTAAAWSFNLPQWCVMGTHPSSLQLNGVLFTLLSTIITDHGRYFVSDEFTEFMTRWNIVHCPRYPQGNSHVEKAVQSVKNIYEKCHDVKMGLLLLKIGPWGPEHIWYLATKYKMSKQQLVPEVYHHVNHDKWGWVVWCGILDLTWQR